MKQKKFAEAIPELEKAVAIQPKNPLLQISLGQAYIATNQTDKGMAAFEKAISVSPSPLTWNNIAYSLWPSKTCSSTAPTSTPMRPSMRWRRNCAT